MKEKFFRHKLISGLFSASFLAVLAGTLWAYAALRGFEPPLIIGFNGGPGIELGSIIHLVAAGVTALIIISVNFRIGLELDARDNFLGKFLAAMTLVLSILIFIGFAAIIAVN